MEEFTPVLPELPEPSSSSPQPEQKSRVWLIVGVIVGAFLLFLSCCCCLLLTLLLVNWEQISQWIGRF
ncbi:MAG: hypothetical protein RMK65_10450 [Anaerolineae bacterium]|nr:hypothetical protein [Anaerolineae bacterium]MDW7992522.1 hypothetical protein [Anaerolineae bacterium]